MSTYVFAAVSDEVGLILSHPVVWVPDPNLVALSDAGSESVAIREKPDLVLESLEQFVPEAWGLPPYDEA